MSYAIRKDGQGWRAVGGIDDVGVDEDYSVTQPLPKIPTDLELMEQATEKVRNAIQSKIDIKAKYLGFSNGNALMLYAGFSNPFQPLAQAFATWEASVWVDAEAYKQEVIAGTKPMLSPDEAVLMMPIYPV